MGEVEERMFSPRFNATPTYDFRWKRQDDPMDTSFINSFL